MRKFIVSSLFFYVLITFSIQVAEAQLTLGGGTSFNLTKPENVKLIKERPLVVIIEGESPALIKSLRKKPEKLQAYKDQVAGRAKALKEAINEYWTFSTKPRFVSSEEGLELMKKGKAVALRVGKIKVQILQRTGSAQGPGRAGFYQDPSTGDFLYNPARRRLSNYDDVSTIEILVDKVKYGAIISYLPPGISGKADLVYAIQQLQYVLNYVNQGNNIKKIEEQYQLNYKELKNKTLLMDREELDKKLSEEDVKAIYPFPFEICDREKIDQAILDKSPEYAYVQLVPVSGTKGAKLNHYVSSAEDGKIYIAYIKNAGLKVLGITKKRTFIEKKHLEFYAKPKY